MEGKLKFNLYSKVVVFSFDTSFAPTVKASMFNTKHQLIWKEDLSTLIDVNYHNVLKDDKVVPDTRESSNINETKKRIVKLKG